MYNAQMITDSISPNGVRLCTIQVTFPRIVLAEFNTHRVFSRNSASSRAIPVTRRIQQVETSPFVPDSFGKNTKGMQQEKTLEGREAALAREIWLQASRDATFHAKRLEALGVHKQYANRLLEPYVWHTVVVTSTEWDNFFALRCHSGAQPEIRIAAEMMREVMNGSKPRELKNQEWHLPYIEWSRDMDLVHQIGILRQRQVSSMRGTVPTGKLSEDDIVKASLIISTIRCAAVSYERQMADRSPEQYVERFRTMHTSGHWSPFEHQAQVKSWEHGEFLGNFRAPWRQQRKNFIGERVFNG